MWNTYSEGVTTNSSHWSDLLVHVSIAESVNAVNFPPDVPYFAGHPLTYHWFSDFNAAIAANAIEAFSVSVMPVASGLLAGALALSGYSIALHLSHSRRTALVAGVLLVFGGGFGWIRLVGDVASGGDPLTLITATAYDMQWGTDFPYFRVRQ